MDQISISSQNNGLDSKISTLERIRDIVNIRSSDDAFYLLDIDNIMEKIHLWRQLLPRVDMYYAVKANYHPKVLQVLADEGLCFDCASKILGEPGRYIVGAAFTLITNIIGKREHLDDQGALSGIDYTINDSVSMSFGNNFYTGKEIHFRLLLKTDDGGGGPRYKGNIWGQTLAQGDVIRSNVTLPNLSLGAWLVWTNMGAYSIVLASNFNGFTQPEVIVQSSQDKINKCNML